MSEAAKNENLDLEDRADDAPEQIRVRAEKRERLLAGGANPYPVKVGITHTLAQLRAAYPDLAAGEETSDEVGVAGRVMLVRTGGKLCFATLQEGDGTRLQVMLSLAEVGEAALAAFKTDVDLGDHLYVHGRVISSKRGELSVLADSWALTCKALRPLPKSYVNQAGEEVTLSEDMRVRRRDLDMIMRPAARDMVRNRAKVVKTLRNFMDSRKLPCCRCCTVGRRLVPSRRI